MDYAIKKGVSLSTLRRHIKANKLTFKVENGRYLLWDDGNVGIQEPNKPNDLEVEFQKLTRDLKKAQEEIAELKTLIAFYEEKIPQQRLNN